MDNTWSLCTLHIPILLFNPLAQYSMSSVVFVTIITLSLLSLYCDNAINTLIKMPRNCRTKHLHCFLMIHFSFCRGFSRVFYVTTQESRGILSRCLPNKESLSFISPAARTGFFWPSPFVCSHPRWPAAQHIGLVHLYSTSVFNDGLLVFFTRVKSDFLVRNKTSALEESYGKNKTRRAKPVRCQPQFD